MSKCQCEVTQKDIDTITEKVYKLRQERIETKYKLSALEDEIKSASEFISLLRDRFHEQEYKRRMLSGVEE